MKKALIGVVAFGVAVAMRPVARRISHEMREHCEQMVARAGGGREAANGAR